jgi:hypothetical protein
VGRSLNDSLIGQPRADVDIDADEFSRSCGSNGQGALWIIS